MSRAAAPLAQVPGVDSDAKLAFVEFLLTSIDVQESARRGVDWLVAHAPVTEAAVLVAEPLSSEMLLVAEHGVTSGTIRPSLNPTRICPRPASPRRSSTTATGQCTS